MWLHSILCGEAIINIQKRKAVVQSELLICFHFRNENDLNFNCIQINEFIAAQSADIS